MKTKCLSGAIAAFGGLLLFLTIPAASAAQTQVLSGHVPAVVKSLQPLERFPGTNHLRLAIGLPLRNQAALSSLLRQIYDPASPKYHHYLTPEQFAERFGPTEADYQAVIAFARTNGLQITSTHPNRVLLDVEGTVTDVERALHVTLRTYRHPTEGRTFFAPDTEPSFDLAAPVLQISGLDSYSLPRPRLVATPLVSGQNATPNSGSGPNGTYMGKDFRAAYVPDTALTGSGQVVGLLQFDGYTASDITYYEGAAGLPGVPLQNVLLDGFSGTPTGDGGEVEVSLDIEMAISMATNLSEVIVYEAGPYGNWHDILNRMATDNLAKQLSCSWYDPNGGSDTVADQIFQQMAAQGQSFFCASGDSDAFTGLIPFPGDTPYITEVGGTTLTTTGPGGSWVSENVWNWGSGIGSGGGISTQYPIPAWQTNISMAANQGSTTMRNVPDVALTADNVYVRADGRDYSVGGTSCASPLWAGFAALANQQAAAAGRPAIGFINPLVDVIGAGANYAPAFHDITTGNNESPSSPTKFSAVTGYDLCTGWGTPVGQALINALANPEALLITPPTGFTSAGGFGGPFTITSQTLSLTNAGTNTITWTLANTSTWLTVTSTGGTLAPGGTAATVTASLNSVASNLVAGIYNATLWFTNLNDNIGQCRQFTLSVVSPPVITAQPTNQAVLEGATAAFSVAATGGLPLAYQWQDNGTNLTDGGNISGSTTTNLVVSDVSAADAGTYTVVVTNLAGTVTSSNALLTITPSAPVITLQPVDETVVVKGTAQFAVVALGTKPLSYQWSFDGTNLVDATNATLTLADVQYSQAGVYSVAVTNIYGSTNSSEAVLTVIPCDPAPPGMVSWWAGEGNAYDSIGNNSGTLVGGAGYAAGEVGQAFSFNGTSSYVSIPDSPSLDSFTNCITIELWLKAGQTNVNSDWESVVSKGGAAWEIQTAGGAKTAGFYMGGPNPSYVTGSRNVADGQWHHVAATYDGTNICLYVDGTLDVSTPATGSIVQNSYPMGIGYNAKGCCGSPAYFYNGMVDEVSLYHRALTASEIQAIYAAGSGGKCFNPTPPTIVTQPTNQTAGVGSAVTLATMATGTQPLSYQWSFDTTNVVGATNATLTLTNVQLNQSGDYAILVTNNYGSILSSNAVLTVTGISPFITIQPINQTVVVGANATFSVAAGGSPPLYYQWNFNGTNLVGATNCALLLTNVQTNQAGTYAVTVSNAFGWIASSNAVLTVNLIPSCDPAPSGLVDWWRAEGSAHDSIGTNNGTLGSSAGFTNGMVGQAFSFNGTSSSYVSIPDSPSLDSFTNCITIELWLKAGQTNVNSDWESVVSKGGAAWEIQTAGGAKTAGFYMGGPNPSYVTGSRNVADGQWHHVAATYDGTNICLYVDGTLDVSTPATGSIVQNSYPMGIGYNAKGCCGSPAYFYNGLVDEVSLYHRALTASEIQAIYAAGSGGKCPPSAPFIVTQPTNQAVALGSAATLAVAAGGTAPLSYQWSFNGTNITGATNTTFAFVNVQLTNAGTYSVMVTNIYGSAISSNAVLTVLTQPPSITTQPTNLTVTLTSNATFSVIASGSPVLSYQWYFNGTNIIGATNTSLTLTNVRLNQAGDYTVCVTNNYGFILSSNAILVVNPLLYFIWNQIPSPRFVNTPFAVVIQAQNLTNGIVTNFTDKVVLLSTNGIPVCPSVSGNFIQGVWTGAVAVAQTATNLVLQATDNLGESGLANPISILNLPALTTMPASSTLYIFWPASPSGFVLETTTGLSPANWVPVTTPPFPIGNQNLLPIQMSGTNAFYRLRFTGQ